MKVPPPIAGQPIIKGEKEIKSWEDKMRNERQERSNELTDPNSPQSKFQRGEVPDDVHYSAKQGAKPEDAPKDIFEQAERDKKAQKERADRIQRGKEVLRMAADLGISVEEAEKRHDEQHKAKAPQSGAQFTGQHAEPGTRAVGQAGQAAKVEKEEVDKTKGKI